MKIGERLRLAACVLPMVLLAACSGAGSETPSGSNDTASAASTNPGPAKEFVAGEVVYQLVQSPTASVRFLRQTDQSILTEFTGNIDKDQATLELFQRAGQEKDSVAMFKVLVPGAAVPAVLENAARLHAEYVAAHPELDPANAKEIRSVGAPVLPAAVGAVSTDLAKQPVTTSPYVKDGLGVSREAVSEPAWDWAADAAWWKSNFCSKNPSATYDRECYLNGTWRQSGDLDSYNLWVYGLAASHVASAHFKGDQYGCSQCWLVATCCGYDNVFDVTLQPRTWKGYHMQGASGGGYKSVNLWGLDPLPHVDMAWQGDRTTYNP